MRLTSNFFVNHVTRGRLGGHPPPQKMYMYFEKQQFPRNQQGFGTISVKTEVIQAVNIDFFEISSILWRILAISTKQFPPEFPILDDLGNIMKSHSISQNSNFISTLNPVKALSQSKDSKTIWKINRGSTGPKMTNFIYQQNGAFKAVATSFAIVTYFI